VILGVGGFLGVGEKNVAVNYTDLQWVTAEDNTERLVLETTKEALNAAPDVELVEDDPADTAATAPAADQPAAEPATEMAATEQPADATDEDETALETGAITNEPAADQPNAMSPVDPFDPATATAIDVATLTADDLKGTNVYGPDNVHIGTVGDFVLSDDGKTVDAIIVDFGGFLGIGTKEVAVAYDNLTFYADPNNNRSLLLNITREQMEQAPAFNRDTYSAERDAQRIVIDGAASICSRVTLRIR
jgi:sporulation protein YlmC with PRC-barrel domain